MRNPVYTVRSHRVHTSNCPSVASQICHQHTHTRLTSFHISIVKWGSGCPAGSNNTKIVCKCARLFVFSAAHNTRVVWAWTWASRNAPTTTPNPPRPAAAEHHTVQTHCPPAHDLVSLTRTHTHMHTYVKIYGVNVPFSPKMSLCLGLHSGIISPLSQVPLVTSSTAQRGSKSLPLPATLARCWGQTEVLLHTAISIITAPWFKLQSKGY